MDILSLCMSTKLKSCLHLSLVLRNVPVLAVRLFRRLRQAVSFSFCVFFQSRQPCRRLFFWDQMLRFPENLIQLHIFNSLAMFTLVAITQTLHILSRSVV